MKLHRDAALSWSGRRLLARRAVRRTARRGREPAPVRRRASHGRTRPVTPWWIRKLGKRPRASSGPVIALLGLWKSGRSEPGWDWLGRPARQDAYARVPGESRSVPGNGPGRGQGKAVPGPQPPEARLKCAQMRRLRKSVRPSAWRCKWPARLGGARPPGPRARLSDAGSRRQIEALAGEPSPRRNSSHLPGRPGWTLRRVNRGAGRDWPEKNRGPGPQPPGARREPPGLATHLGRAYRHNRARNPRQRRQVHPFSDEAEQSTLAIVVQADRPGRSHRLERRHDRLGVAARPQEVEDPLPGSPLRASQERVADLPAVEFGHEHHRIGVVALPAARARSGTPAEGSQENPDAPATAASSESLTPALMTWQVGRPSFRLARNPAQPRRPPARQR
jgi:hypothetical protein